ncbi:MAG: hypothetical protein M1829_002063 [Trizodia sp. TS-e1964]|nr:MAG: hypothetical protein M1829_002063 [Trizodia sp. TS-e1964]
MVESKIVPRAPPKPIPTLEINEDIIKPIYVEDSPAPTFLIKLHGKINVLKVYRNSYFKQHQTQIASLTACAGIPHVPALIEQVKVRTRANTAPYNGLCQDFARGHPLPAYLDTALPAPTRTAIALQCRLLALRIGQRGVALDDQPEQDIILHLDAAHRPTVHYVHFEFAHPGRPPRAAVATNLAAMAALLDRRAYSMSLGSRDDSQALHAEYAPLLCWGPAHAPALMFGYRSVALWHNCKDYARYVRSAGFWNPAVYYRVWRDVGIRCLGGAVVYVHYCIAGLVLVLALLLAVLARGSLVDVLGRENLLRVLGG